jgi:hypothetical protein
VHRHFFFLLIFLYSLNSFAAYHYQVMPEKNLIDDVKSGWTHKIQGIQMDPRFIFISNKLEIWRFDHTGLMKKRLKFSDDEKGIKKIRVPWSLEKKGFDHYCDMELFNNQLYVPLEGPTKPHLIFKFDVDSMEAVGMAEVPLLQKDIPWIAIHPKTGEIFSSNFFITPTDAVKYYVELPKISGGDDKDFFLHPSGELVLKKNGKARKLDRVQGGTFVDEGNTLVLVSDIEKQGGLYLFDSETGEEVFYQKIKFNKGFPHFHELEGISYQEESEHIQKNIKGKNYEKRGTLFVVMLNHQIFKSRASILRFSVWRSL